jgi:steroid 5-alpha reductase family enzyme
MVGVLISRPLLATFLITIVVQLTTYTIAVVNQFDTITDLSGTSNFVILAWTCVYFSHLTRRKLALVIMVTIWGVRLGRYLFTRVLQRGKDERFDKIRIHPIRFLAFFLIQALWVWIVSFPVTLAITSPVRTKLNKIDYLGWALWFIGFLWEAIGDSQKSAFNANPENKNQILKTGLYRFSRYPNYFGEILLWTGIFITSSNQLHDYELAIACISPFFTFYLLRYLSGVPLGDKKYNSRYEKLEDLTEEWREYKESTNILIPWFPRSK